MTLIKPNTVNIAFKILTYSVDKAEQFLYRIIFISVSVRSCFLIMLVDKTSQKFS